MCEHWRPTGASTWAELGKLQREFEAVWDANKEELYEP